MHAVIGWVLSEEHPKQTCRHDRPHILELVMIRKLQKVDYRQPPPKAL